MKTSVFCGYVNNEPLGHGLLYGIREYASSNLVDLDSIKDNYDGGKIRIDFSTEQLDALVNLVFDYTRKLEKVSSVEMSELEEPIPASGDKTMIDLRNYLEAQKRIFEKVS